MDIMGIAKLSTSLADTGLKDDIGNTVLKRAEDLQASVATQLLDAVQSAAPAPNLPPHLGQHVNTTA